MEHSGRKRPQSSADREPRKRLNQAKRSVVMVVVSVFVVDVLKIDLGVAYGLP